MSAALYWWRATRRGSGRSVLAVALIGGLLGAVALGALAGARRTASAYDRYLAASKASDAFVNVPGVIPGLPVTRPATLISHLPGVTASAAYLGIAANPVVRGRVDDSFTTDSLSTSLTGDYFRQDKMTVLAGRLPRSADEIALTPLLASTFGARVGSRVTYEFYRARGGTFEPAERDTFVVTAIVDIPPVLVDDSDDEQGAVLPPAAVRRTLPFYEYSWVGLRLKHGAAGIPGLQHRLASLADRLQRQVQAGTHRRLPGLSFDISRSDVLQKQVRQAIEPQVVALTIFGGIAALAMLVLAGQGLAQLLSRSIPDIAAIRALGGTRAQAALAVSLPGGAALLGSAVVAVAGAVALSPLAPVGSVRTFDPARGLQADGLALGAGAALLAAALTGLLAVLAGRAVRQSARPMNGRPSVIASAAASAGLPAAAVVGSRNALEPGSGPRAVPVRATMFGAIAAVTAVVAAVVFGTSLTGLTSHPARYGWRWDVLIQSQAGYGGLPPGRTSEIIDSQPAVTAWSAFGFGQIPVDRQVIPVLGLQRYVGSVEPPTTSGQPITGNDQIELGAVTLRELGKHIGDTVRVGRPPDQRRLKIVGSVTLPSFGVALTEHVSLGRGAMMSAQALRTAEGVPPGAPLSAARAVQFLPSAVALVLAPGTSAAQRARIVRTITAANLDHTPGGTYQLTHFRAAAINNASQMGGQPLALGLGLTVAAVLSLALTVLASVRRRRRELALLKTLGMTKGQVRAVISWQTTIILTIAAAVGIPLGTVAGRWAWGSFADSLGVVAAPVIPLVALLLGLAMLLATGNLLALLPAAVAARIPPAATLRSQ